MNRIYIGFLEDNLDSLRLDTFESLKDSRRNLISSKSKEVLKYLDQEAIDYSLVDDFAQLEGLELGGDINYFTKSREIEPAILKGLEGYKVCFLKSFPFSKEIEAEELEAKDFNLAESLVIRSIKSEKELASIENLIKILYGETYKVYFLKQEGIGNIEVLRLEDKLSNLEGDWPLNLYLEGSGGHGIDQLLGIMEDLRGEQGCSWDRAQTHESLKGCLIEEAYELLDAIEKKDDELMAEELGDLLLQVIFHSQLAREEGRFSFQNVVNTLGNKLIYRHPHVFSQKGIEKEDEIIYNWDKLKYRAKDIDTLTGRLEDVSKSSALLRSFKIQDRMAKVGFDWPDISGPFEKIAEEKSEVREFVEMDLIDYDRIEEEVGDLFFSVVNLSRFLKVDPDIALQKASDKFISRVAKMEAIGLDQELDFTKLSLDAWELLWKKAKLSEK